VNFQNTVVVMTSNIGAHSISAERKMGFGDTDNSHDYSEMKAAVLGDVKKFFRPEFLNRLDDTIVFHALEHSQIAQIAGLMLKAVADRLKERGIELTVSQKAVEALAEKGYDPAFGARPLRRTIQRQVEDALSEEILAGTVKLGSFVEAEWVEDRLVFTNREPALQS
jgi:ATP-dependent Clp protease ATP-binding subunit ClpC